MDPQQLCQQVAQMLNGKPSMENGVCSVSILRHLNVTIQGRPTHGAIHAGLTFESLDQEGNALNLGEVALLEDEVPRFTNSLISNGLIVSAIHNHWLFANPNLIYVHYQSVEAPLAFAHKTAQACMYKGRRDLLDDVELLVVRVNS